MKELRLGGVTISSSMIMIMIMIIIIIIIIINSVHNLKHSGTKGTRLNSLETQECSRRDVH